jgi:hypothetical protein
MQIQRAVLALAVGAACALAGCRDAPSGGHTAVMGGSDGKAGPQAPEAFTDARGRPIPQPPVPPNAAVRMARVGDGNAIAVWLQEGTPVAAAFGPATGWSAPQPLEDIHGDASDLQLAANEAGAAMALWRHTVGSIQSLRFSRFEPATGWSVPDVMPGALPRPAGQASPPQLQMDDAGNVTARWPSGFDPQETQASRYTPGQGWSRAVSARLASGPSASPAPPSPSAGR